MKHKIKSMILLCYLGLLSAAMGNELSAGFIHPGISHNQAELAFVKSKIQTQEQPWQQAWEEMRSSKSAAPSWMPRAVARVERGAYENRLAKGFEYTARYNLGNDVPFAYYESYQGKYKHQTISDKSRGRLRPMYDKIVNHTHNRMGMDMLWCQKAIEKTRPECGGTMPWSTLMYADQPGGLVALVKTSQSPKDLLGEAPVDWVDPLIDTHESRWFYFNSASRPFGMVNLSPDTQTKGSWTSGYLYGDKTIRCFSHIHAWQLSGIPVMPIVGEMTGYQGMDVYQSEFSHDDEVVKAGYHKVYLEKYRITVELTSTVRTGFHRYTYPATQDAYVLFDLGALLGHGPTVSAEVQRVSDTEIVGMSLMKGTSRRKKDTPVYFVAQFNQAMTAFGGWEQGGVKEGVDAVQGKDVGAFVRFQTKSKTPILMKVGISYTSIDGARRNLKAECAHWDFDRVVEDSKEDWNAHLARITVEGGSETQKTKFYTDLWRSLLGRRVVSDVDGAYSDMTGEERIVRKIPVDENGSPKFNMHNSDAWWGSHWSLNILWPLLCPERVSDFCNTSVAMYENGGLIPRGPSGGNYTYVMIGDSAAPFITSAYAKGIRDFDCEKALEGLVKNTGPTGGRYYGGYATKPTPSVYEEYQEKGYVSWGNSLSGGHGKAVTSLTLYNAYHDWCIAQMAQGLKREETKRQFEAGAKNYRHVIWPEKQSAWVRMPDGSWMPNYLPREETFEQKGFCETSAAVTTFYVPHDPMGLADMLGGPAAAAQKLNEQFEAAVKDKFHLRGRTHGNAWVDYANQDGTGMAHYFNRIGFPWLSQKWVRAVQSDTFGGTDPYSGYNGDEDQGQMGALSALMTIGLFQFDGGSGLDSCYDITAPVFDKVTIALNPKYYPGKTFTIIAKNQAPENIYIQSARWNGQSLLTCSLAHKDLIQGGTLELDLGAKPNKQMGSRNH